MMATGYAHIDVRDDVPYIEGTRTRVLELAIEHRHWRLDADQLQRQHPHLTLGQIHSALTYYFDHQDMFACMIADEERFWADVRAGARESPLALALRRLGLVVRASAGRTSGQATP